MAEWDDPELLRAAIEGAEVGLWCVDPATGLNRRDGNLNRMLGLPAEPTTVTLDEVFSQIHPEDRDRAQATWERALAEGESCQIENRVRCPDGRVRWLRDRGQVRADAHGRPRYVTGAVVDITERKQVEEELRERSRALEILNRVSTGIARELDLARLVQHVTDVGTELTGAAFGAFFYNVLNERPGGRDPDGPRDQRRRASSRLPGPARRPARRARPADRAELARRQPGGARSRSARTAPGRSARAARGRRRPSRRPPRRSSP